MKKVLFIDRDGTIILEPPTDFQVDSLDKLEFYPKVIQNLAKIMTELDFELVMVTNQDGLGTDSFPEEDFRIPQEKMLTTLANENIIFSDILVDNSFESENSPNRKPRTGLLQKYIFGNYDLKNSYVIGDRKTDVELAKNLETKVATSYPSILQNYFDNNNITAEIVEISGSVEIAPSIGLADSIADLVSSGSTLLHNGLTEVQQVLTSEAVLISSKKLSPEVAAILESFLFRIQAVINSRENKYILLNAPNDSIEKIIEILPGIKSPTVLPLAQSGWSSIHSVVRESEFWEIIDELKKQGAEGILVVPIEKMIL